MSTNAFGHISHMLLAEHFQLDSTQQSQVKSPRIEDGNQGYLRRPGQGAVFLERVEIAAHDDAGETGRFGLRERMAELERICEGS